MVTGADMFWFGCETFNEFLSEVRLYFRHQINCGSQGKLYTASWHLQLQRDRWRAIKKSIIRLHTLLRALRIECSTERVRWELKKWPQDQVWSNFIYKTWTLLPHVAWSFTWRTKSRKDTMYNQLPTHYTILESSTKQIWLTWAVTLCRSVGI